MKYIGSNKGKLEVSDKVETVHCMYRNHGYFGDGFGSRYVEVAYDTNNMMLIFEEKK
jgi:hypothetical protein